METNPYAAYFARLDELVPKLEDNMLDETEGPELADLVRRAAFFVANTLNTAAVTSPHLILQPETVEGETGDPSKQEPGTT